MSLQIASWDGPFQVTGHPVPHSTCLPSTSNASVAKYYKNMHSIHSVTRDYRNTATSKHKHVLLRIQNGWAYCKVGIQPRGDVCIQAFLKDVVFASIQNNSTLQNSKLSHYTHEALHSCYATLTRFLTRHKCLVSTELPGIVIMMCINWNTMNILT